MAALESLKRDIEYVRTLERMAVFQLGINEIYSFVSSGTSDEARGVISRYLKDLTGIRKKIEEKLEGSKNES